jgi:hypothetical protein
LARFSYFACLLEEQLQEGYLTRMDRNGCCEWVR